MYVALLLLALGAYFLTCGLGILWSQTLKALSTMMFKQKYHATSFQVYRMMAWTIVGGILIGCGFHYLP